MNVCDAWMTLAARTIHQAATMWESGSGQGWDRGEGGGREEGSKERERAGGNERKKNTKKMTRRKERK